MSNAPNEKDFEKVAVDQDVPLVLRPPVGSEVHSAIETKNRRGVVALLFVLLIVFACAVGLVLRCIGISNWVFSREVVLLNRIIHIPSLHLDSSESLSMVDHLATVKISILPQDKVIHTYTDHNVISRTNRHCYVREKLLDDPSSTLTEDLGDCLSEVIGAHVVPRFFVTVCLPAEDTVPDTGMLCDEKLPLPLESVNPYQERPMVVVGFDGFGEFPMVYGADPSDECQRHTIIKRSVADVTDNLDDNKKWEIVVNTIAQSNLPNISIQLQKNASMIGVNKNVIRCKLLDVYFEDLNIQSIKKNSTDKLVLTEDIILYCPDLIKHPK